MYFYLKTASLTDKVTLNNSEEEHNAIADKVKLIKEINIELANNITQENAITNISIKINEFIKKYPFAARQIEEPVMKFFIKIYEDSVNAISRKIGEDMQNKITEAGLNFKWQTKRRTLAEITSAINEPFLIRCAIIDALKHPVTKDLSYLNLFLEKLQRELSDFSDTSLN